MDFEIPKVMGILNITDDSFYSRSRTLTEKIIRERTLQMLEEGVDIIDIGGCSTRPGYKEPPLEIEMNRVELGCRIVRELSSEIPISVDTYRSYIAEKAIVDWNVNIINDISGGVDPDMWSLLGREHLPYVLTYNKSFPAGVSDITAEIISDLSKGLNELHRKGVNDVIIDPGFGFEKNLEQNFCIFDELNEFVKIGVPILVGISRKSIIYKTLDYSPEESLNGTIALNAIALEKGTNILRVHDVKAAKETVKLYSAIKNIVA